MLSASVPGWPLWLAGVMVALTFYAGVAYLLAVGFRATIVAVRRFRLALRERDRARVYDGEAHPTLFEVAVARAVEATPPVPRPPTPAVLARSAGARERARRARELRRAERARTAASGPIRRAA
jgi:hypothetical protein